MILLADNIFELIFQHLSFKDIVNLSETSKSIHEIIANSRNCMKKIKLNLVKNNDDEIVEFTKCFKNNKRKYQNIVVNCHNNHHTTEKYMLMLKHLERSIVELDVINASFRWDEINTRNFTDQWLILTDLKKLKASNINDYTAEIFFISCTYLEDLHVENVRLNKYFNYCLRTNEKLKQLKILHPQGISYDYEFYGFTEYNFKLNHFEYVCNEEMERNKHAFLRRVIYPILISQLEYLKFCNIDGVFIDVSNAVLKKLNENENFVCDRMAIALTDECVKLKINDLEINAIDCLAQKPEFYKNFSQFVKKNSSWLRTITISLINNYDEDITSILFNDFKEIQLFEIGGCFENIYNNVNDKITKIHTSSTCFEEIKTFLKAAPKLKELQIFELTGELLNFIENEMIELDVIYYHYMDVKCGNASKKLVKINSLDPLLRICCDLHELIFQHLDKLFVRELTENWTRIYFK